MDSFIPVGLFIYRFVQSLPHLITTVGLIIVVNIILSITFHITALPTDRHIVDALVVITPHTSERIYPFGAYTVGFMKQGL